VARVDGAPILRHEVAETIAAARMTGQALTSSQALDAMIKRRLVEAEARRSNISVSVADVQARFDQVAQSVGGQTTLAESLSQVGLTTAAYRAQLSGALLAERLADARFSRVKASPSRAQAYYRSHLAQFTVPAAVKLGDIEVKTERMAQAVEKRLRQGYSFAITARQYSSDPDVNSNNGKLGWIQADSLPADIAKALDGLPVGRVTRPAQGIGWHVLKLFGRRAARTYPFSKVRGALEKELTREARATALAHQLTVARAQAIVVILP
jgi:parvulin-like peptidyl-prolyl isomerase